MILLDYYFFSINIKISNIKSKGQEKKGTDNEFIYIVLDNGEIQITSAKLAPVIDFYQRSGDGFRFSVYRLSDYTDELAAKQAQSGATVEYFTDLSKKVVSEEFLDLN